MSLAIKEAYKGFGKVSPNPLVGCVVIDSKGELISQGHHEYYGGPHAEVNALKNLKEGQLKGARVFVTLEPCAHEGKTPSCAKMLAKLPIKEVIYGLMDPNPLVAGQGAKIIEAAGIKVTLFSELKEELEEVCEHFLMNQKQKKVFVSLKVASSLDGQLSLKNGESKWITSEASREHAHWLRAHHDAILVGANTVLTDDPSLNIRLSQNFENKKVVILDSNQKVKNKLKELKISKQHKPENVLIYEKQDLNKILSNLWDLGIRSVLVEGGAQVLSSFINEKKADRLYLFQAPVILGANSGKAWSQDVKIDSLKDKIALRSPKVSNFSQDILISGRIFS